MCKGETQQATEQATTTKRQQTFPFSIYKSLSQPFNKFNKNNGTNLLLSGKDETFICIESRRWRQHYLFVVLFLVSQCFLFIYLFCCSAAAVIALIFVLDLSSIVLRLLDRQYFPVSSPTRVWE